MHRDVNLTASEEIVPVPVELEPLSLIINKNVGTILYYARQHDQAIDEYLQTLELDPAFVRTRFYLGLAYEQQGLFGEATAELKKAVQLSGGNSVCLAMFGHACAPSGRRSEAQEVLGQLEVLRTNDTRRP